MSEKHKETSRGASVSYLTKEGLSSVWTNRLMSLASIAVLTSCLVIIGCAVMLFMDIGTMLNSIEDQNVIMVFLDDDATSAQETQVGSKIKELSGTDSIKFIPKEESYKQQVKSLGSDAYLLDGLDSNPLPDAYEVTVSDMAQFKNIVSSVKSMKHVLNVRENSQLAAKLVQMRKTVTFISVGMIVMLLVVSLFIIANTVRVTMYSRRREISIMKAVGATNAFIRWPFVIEGMTIGIFSGLLSELIVFAIYGAVNRSIQTAFMMFGSQTVPFSSYAWVMLVCFILVGVLAGSVGSAVSMSRYLKEEGSVVSEKED
jgi:cell division transport system permease protein